MRPQLFIVNILKSRLDKYLSEQIKKISRSQIQRDIEAGLVLVNCKKVLESKFVVRKGDKVKYQTLNIKYQKDTVKPINAPLKVLYDNYGLLVIDKPAGMVVHPGAGFKGETLASALLYYFRDIKLVGEEARPGIIHRLDKDTSGVMLVAKTQKMYEHLKDAFTQKRVKKEYLALVLGKLEKPYGFIDTPIGKSKNDFRKYATENIIKPKEALTEYWVLEYLSRVDPSTPLGVAASKNRSLDQYTLVRVQLHTGRTHQIRVHFSSIGHPVMGDKLYGLRLRGRSDSRSGKKAQFAGLDRQFLHSKKIEVRLPDGMWVEAESELAEDLREVLKRLNSKIVNQL